MERCALPAIADCKRVYYVNCQKVHLQYTSIITERTNSESVLLEYEKLSFKYCQVLSTKV